MKLKTFFLALLCATLTWAQGDISQMSLSDKLAELDLDSCRIKDIGIVVSDIEYYLKTTTQVAAASRSSSWKMKLTES